jgi:hypothetical protein
MENIHLEIFVSGGFPNAKIQSEGKAITLHSIAPFKEAERAAAKFNPALSWVLIAGFGFGYLARWLLEHTHYKVIVFEHSGVILEQAVVYEEVKQVLKDERVILIQEDTGKVIDFLRENNIKELNFYIHRPYWTLFPSVYSSFEGILIAYLSKKNINQATLKRFQKVWLKNIVKNSSFYFSSPGINSIRHTFRNKPAVIVGAGPSLEKNIHILRDIQERVLIIATDTALSILYENGIKPDFVVSVDPQDKNTLYLLYSQFKEAWLVIDAAASFLSLIKYNPSKTIFFDTIFPLYESLKPFWGEKGSLLSGGSVSTNAFDFARFLGCSPIVFVGQDLAYSRKHTHIRGNILEEFLRFKTNRFHTYESYNSKMLLFSDKIEVEGVNGEKVLTDRKFVTFLDWFKNEFAYTQAEVINATEGGAFIQGAKHLSLEETAREKLKEVKMDKNFSLEWERKSDAAYRQYLEAVSQEVERLLPYGKKALEASKKAKDIFKKKGNPSHLFSTMTDFDLELLSSIRLQNSTARFLELSMQESIEKILDGEQKKQITEETLENWKQFYEEAYYGLKRIKWLLNKRKPLTGL